MELQFYLNGHIIWQISSITYDHMYQSQQSRLIFCKWSIEFWNCDCMFDCGLYFIITKDNSMVVSHIVETNIESVRITPILHTTIWYISYNNADKLFI